MSSHSTDGRRVRSRARLFKSRTRKTNSSGRRNTISIAASGASSPTLLPAEILIGRYFVAERDRITALEGELARLEQELGEMFEEHGGEEGLLNEVVDGEGDKRKVVAKAVKPRLKTIGKDPDYADERAALEKYSKLLDVKDKIKDQVKTAEEELDAKLDAKYPKLTEDEIKTLVVDDKWLAKIAEGVQSELDRVSQNLTGRIRQLAERYETPLPKLDDQVIALRKRVDEHLREMGTAWN